MWCKVERNKDKGYAWVVLLASFLSHLMHLGFLFGVTGNLTIAYKYLLDIDVQLSSLIGTLNAGLTFLAAPLAAILVKKLGCAATQLIGGILMITSIALSSLTTEVWHAILLFGVIAAIGASCCYSACSQILPQYFNRFKYFAFSTVIFGSYIGPIVWPVVSQHLIDTYGVSKAMGLMSIFHIVHIIAAPIFISPSSTDKTTADADKETDGICEKECVASNKSESKDGENREASWSVMLAECRTMLKSTKIWLLLLNGFFWNCTDATFRVLINDYIVDRTGISAEEAALGVSISGIASAASCLAVVCSSSLRYDRVVLHSTSIMVFAVATIAIAFSNGKAMYYVLIAIYGIGNGITLTNLLSVLTEFCTPQQLTMLFGIHLLVEGIGSLLAVPFIGYISAVSTQLIGMVLCGSAGIVASLCLIPPILSNRKRKRYEQY